MFTTRVLQFFFLRGAENKDLLCVGVPVPLLVDLFLESGILLGVLKFSRVNTESTDAMLEFKGASELWSSRLYDWNRDDSEFVKLHLLHIQDTFESCKFSKELVFKDKQVLWNHTSQLKKYSLTSSCIIVVARDTTSNGWKLPTIIVLHYGSIVLISVALSENNLCKVAVKWEFKWLQVKSK